MTFETAPFESTRLAQPVKLIDQAWPAGTPPVVSIICVCFNHARFVAECLDGFLAQETTFPVEIVVHDDASTDGSVDIIRAYANRFPRLFRTVLQEKNRFTFAGASNRDWYNLARGKYYALCEADDFWIYPRKLEEQVAVLESDPEVALVSHEVKWVSETGEEIPHWRRLAEGERVEYRDTDALKCNFNHPNSWVARTAVDISAQYPMFERLPAGDDPWCLALLQNGMKGVSIGHAWSAYRQHGKGMWSTLAPVHRRFQELVIYVSERRFYAPRYKAAFDRQIAENRLWLAGHFSNAATQGKWKSLRTILFPLRYRSSYFAPWPEIVVIVCLAVRDAASRIARGILRRMAAVLGFSRCTSASMSPR